MKILYLNIQGVIEGTGRAMRTCGHNLVLRSGCVESLETLRSSTFDAAVIEDYSDAPEILHSTVEAHQSQAIWRTVAAYKNVRRTTVGGQYGQ
jgi:hypothetical protein